MKLVSTEPHELGLFAFGHAPVGVIAIGIAPVGVVAIGFLARGVVVLSAGVGVGLVSVGLGLNIGLYVRCAGFSFRLCDEADDCDVAVFHADSEGALGRIWSAVKLSSLLAIFALSGLSGWAQYSGATEDAAIERTLTRKATLEWQGTMKSMKGKSWPAEGSLCALAADVRTDGKSATRAHVRLRCGGREVHTTSFKACRMSLAAVNDVGATYDLQCPHDGSDVDTAAGRATFQWTDDDDTITARVALRPGATSTVDLIAR